jgi:REP-associated tyrosine transposase
MARALRPNIADGMYHITARGVRRSRIYDDGVGYRRFLALFRRVSNDLGWISHAYCLMPNHYHLVLETAEPNLSAGMQRLNSQYAAWFNWRHGFVGHVFESRFYSGVIEFNAHFLELSRYVVLNPVRAGLCRHPKEWPFSSYRTVPTAKILDQFGSDPISARARYTQFIAQGVPASRVPGSDPRTRPDQPKPYVPAKRSPSRRTSRAAGRPTTFR